ncbi:MAG TPA: hypothetical protein VGK45_08700 [Thermoanaerobaculia bacterium]
MSLLLLNTNTLNYILKNVPPVTAKLEDAVRQGKSFLLSSVAHYELTRLPPPEGGAPPAAALSAVDHYLAAVRAFVRELG